MKWLTRDRVVSIISARISAPTFRRFAAPRPIWIGLARPASFMANDARVSHRFLCGVSAPKRSAFSQML
jgi:hypothetical protein